MNEQSTTQLGTAVAEALYTGIAEETEDEYDRMIRLEEERSAQDTADAVAQRWVIVGDHRHYRRDNGSREELATLHAYLDPTQVNPLMLGSYRGKAARGSFDGPNGTFKPNAAGRKLYGLKAETGTIYAVLCKLADRLGGKAHYGFEASVESAPNGYGFGHDWTLVVERDGRANRLWLGQDAKVFARIIGCRGEDLLQEIQAETGSSAFDDPLVNRAIGRRIVTALYCQWANDYLSDVYDETQAADDIKEGYGWSGFWTLRFEDLLLKGEPWSVAAE